MPEQRHVRREDLCREAAFTVVRAEDGDGGDGLTLDGYGAVFDAVTTIASWEGEFEEVLARGAFRKSLRERTPRIQFDHGRHPMVGSIPIGRITEITEDERGLHVVARLSDNWLVAPVRDAIRDGGIDGMSFRFSVVREEWVDATGKKIKPEDVDKALFYPSMLDYDVATPLRRTLKEVRVSEVGPVVWPAYEATTVGVRSRTIDLGRLDEPEQRELLAKAVLLADAAESGETPTDRGTSTNDAPRSTDADPGEHPLSAPLASEAESGEHPSPKSDAAKQRLRDWALFARGTLASIEPTKIGDARG